MTDARRTMQDTDDRVAALAIELREAREALRRADSGLPSDAERRMHAFIDCVPQGVHEYALQPDGRLLLVGANSAAERILGIDHHALIGLELEDAFPGNAGTHIPDAFRAVALIGEPFEDRQYFYDDQRVGGAYEIVAFQTAPMRMAVLFRDITARVHTEVELLASETRLRAMIDAAPYGITEYTLEPGGRLTLTGANPAACGILAVDCQSLLGRAIEDAFPGFAGLPLADALRAVAHSGERHDEYAFPYTDAQVAGTFALSAFQTGPSRMAMLFRDVTERRAAQEQIQFQAHLLGCVGQAVIATDTDLRITYWNRAAEELYGWTAADAVGRRTHDLLVAPEHVPDAIAVVARLQRGEPCVGEFSYLRRDGSRVLVEVADTPIHDAEHRLVGFVGVSSDITARKRDECALMASEERYRLATEATGQIVYDYDIASGEIRWDGAITQLTGFSRDAMQRIGVSAWEARIHPDDRERAVSSLARAVAAGDDYRAEYRFARRDGSYFDAEDWGVVLRDSDRTPLRMIGAMRDMTSRHLADLALRESEVRYRTLVETAQDGVALLDLEGTIVFANRREAEMLDIADPAELIGRNALDWLAPDQRAWAAGLLSLTVVQGSLSHLEMTIHRQDGSTFEADLNATAITDGDRPRFIMVTKRDVTARRQAEEALAAETERLAVTLRSIADGVIATDTRGRVVLMNPVAEQITGWPQRQATGRPLAEVLNMSVAADTTDSETHGLLRQTRLTARTGEVREVAWRATPIRNSRSEVIGQVTVVRDVTAENRLQADVQRMAKLESVGVLAGGIAHDFNNLLTAIGGNIGLAQFATNAGDNVRLARYLAEAERATLRARDLTQQLLTFARGGAPIRTEVDLGPVIRDAVTFALTGSRSRGCIDIASGLWMAYADAGQVSQVLHNLLLNADQAMPEAGTITISATNVNVADDSGLPLPPGAYVSVRVADHGGGIPSDMRERIFDPFFTTKQRGSGLGLASSFSIVKGHEGHIRLESELGKGSVFTVYLPAVPTAVAVREDEAPAASVLRPMRILVMDDEGMVADMLAELLRQGGHMPTTTAHGEAALRAWLAATDDGTPFDLAILDLTVPGGMGGADTLRMLKAHDPKVRAIASSGYATDPILAEYAAHGFVGRLAKPYRFAEVLAVLAEVQQDNAPRTANT